MGYACLIHVEKSVIVPGIDEKNIQSATTHSSKNTLKIEPLEETPSLLLQMELPVKREISNSKVLYSPLSY
jgi:hypothetical protein